MRRLFGMGRLVRWLRALRSRVRLGTGSGTDLTAMSATERRFRTVFSTLPDGRRNALVLHYQRRHSCSRAEAMQRAMDDRARDNGLRV